MIFNIIKTSWMNDTGLIYNVYSDLQAVEKPQE